MAEDQAAHEHQRFDDSTIEADTALGKFKVSSANLNTIMSIFSFVITCLIAWVLWTHNGDARETSRDVAAQLSTANKEIAVTLKDANKELAGALKEMSQATREQNCLLSLPIANREQNAETCRRLSK